MSEATDKESRSAQPQQNRRGPSPSVTEASEATAQRVAAERVTNTGGRRSLFNFGASQPKLELDLEKLGAPSVDLWANSPERDWYISRRPHLVKFLIPAGVLATIAVILAQPSMRTATTLWWAAICGGLSAVIALWCTVPYWAARRAFLERRAKIAVYRADNALHQLGMTVAKSGGNGKSAASTTTDIPLTTLFKLNRRQLDAYQDTTRRQQRNAFRLAQVASVVGMAVLVTGIVLTFRNDPGTNDYVVGGLTGLGALLSAFLGHTFYRTHREANAQLNWYYTEPYAMGRLLVAERIAHVLCADSAQKAELAKTMVTALLSWELPNAQAAGSPQDTSQDEAASGGQADQS